MCGSVGKASDTQAVGRGTRVAGSRPALTNNIDLIIIFRSDII